jgi:hypothetical protein
MADQPASMIEVYRRFLGGELPLEEAAHLLRRHARFWPAEAGSLKLDALSDAEREKAEQLFGEAIQPILASFLAREVDGEADSVREITYRETENYRITHDFLNSPERYFQHLFRTDSDEESDA